MEITKRWNGRPRMKMDGMGSMAKTVNEMKRRNMTR
jgi:hypothetical protein